MSEEPPVALQGYVQDFADKIGGLLAACLPNAPDVEVTEFEGRLSIRPEGQQQKRGGVPLQVQGKTLAWLRLDYLCRLDVMGGLISPSTSRRFGSWPM